MSSVLVFFLLKARLPGKEAQHSATKGKQSSFRYTNKTGGNGIFHGATKAFQSLSMFF